MKRITLSPEEKKLVERWRLLPAELKRAFWALIRQSALPHDPRYRAYERAEHERYLAREKLPARRDEPDQPEPA